MDGDGFHLATSRVAIVGLGLMGASLAMDLRGHCAEIIGVSRSADTLEYALSHHIVDRVAEFGPELDCDLLILAAPVRTIIRQLEALGMAARTGRKTVILDLGSTKTEIVRAMQNLPERFDPIGGHPMCGKEVAGIRQAETSLYRSHTFVLTPLERTTPQAMALVQKVLEVIGAAPLILTAERQDELVALTSHLPYLLASALMKAAISHDDPQLWQVAASGFRDTSRLAASDLAMMIDILLTNREAILAALEDCQAELSKLSGFLQDSDEEALRAFLTETQQKRAQLFRGSIQ
jgi:prephenate dehydrogenase